MKSQKCNRLLYRYEKLKVEVYDNLREVSNGYYLDLGIFTVTILIDEGIVKLIDPVCFNAYLFFKMAIISYCIALFECLNREEVIHKCKKNTENELYKNSLIAKVEVDLSYN